VLTTLEMTSQLLCKNGLKINFTQLIEFISLARYNNFLTFFNFYILILKVGYVVWFRTIKTVF